MIWGWGEALASQFQLQVQTWLVEGREPLAKHFPSCSLHTRAQRRPTSSSYCRLAVQEEVQAVRVPNAGQRSRPGGKRWLEAMASGRTAWPGGRLRGSWEEMQCWDGS